MCKICSDWQLGKLTIKEAWRNLQETVDGIDGDEEKLDHYFEVANKLLEEDEKLKS